MVKRRSINRWARICRNHKNTASQSVYENQRRLLPQPVAWKSLSLPTLSGPMRGVSWPEGGASVVMVCSSSPWCSLPWWRRRLASARRGFRDGPGMEISIFSFSLFYWFIVGNWATGRNLLSVSRLYFVGSSKVLLWRGSERAFHECLGVSNVFPSAAQVQIWLRIIMRWQVYHLARLVVKVVRFYRRGTHWWAAPLYQKQRNQPGLNNWFDCLA